MVTLGSGRNTLITDHVAAIIAINDVPNYPLLTPLTAANVRYGLNLPNNVRSALIKNNKLILFGLGETIVTDKTLGGHQWLVQSVWAMNMVLGMDTENDQKLVVTMAEELESYLYSNRVKSANWYFAGRQRMAPGMWSHGKSHLVRTFLMEFKYKKLGTEGVP